MIMGELSMKKQIYVMAMVLGIAVSISLVCLAASSTQMINYQGRLTDSGGMVIDGDSVDVVFSIYGVASGGTALWSEPQAIAVNNGIYSVQLGKINPIPSSLFNASDRWLGVKVGTDAEMMPRAQITSVAYAMNSQRIAGKIIQSGQGVLTVSDASTGSANVTFPAPFADPPQVIVGALNAQITGKTFIVDQVTNITTTGCTISFISLDGSSSSGSANFDWIAIGE